MNNNELQYPSTVVTEGLGQDELVAFEYGDLRVTALLVPRSCLRDPDRPELVELPDGEGCLLLISDTMPAEILNSSRQPAEAFFKFGLKIGFTLSQVAGGLLPCSSNGTEGELSSLGDEEDAR